MIKDKIENIGHYKLNEYFEIFKNLILKNNAPPLNLNTPLRVILLEYETKNFDLSKFENHKKNIDIHYIIDGTEQIGINLVGNLKSNIEYNEDGDYQLFDGRVEDKIILNPGEFLLLFPGEAHVTGGNVIGSAMVKKIVYKIPF